MQQQIQVDLGEKLLQVGVSKSLPCYHMVFTSSVSCILQGTSSIAGECWWRASVGSGVPAALGGGGGDESWRCQEPT